MENIEDLPDEVRSLINVSEEMEMDSISAWTPSSENEYISGLIQILPDTWLFDVLTGEDTDRLRAIAYAYLSIGKMDLMWDSLSVAEQWLVNKIRLEKATAIDYINYGHCLLLRGDRMMAYENYLQARQLCKSAKEFFTLFRPDRKDLVEHGVPLEQVYFLEDQLLKS